jgi:hypothetical protein
LKHKVHIYNIKNFSSYCTECIMHLHNKNNVMLLKEIITAYSENGENTMGTLTHSFMELSPSWEAVTCAATQEILSILWNPKVHYRVHKSPPWSLSWARSIQSTPSHPISHGYTMWAKCGVFECENRIYTVHSALEGYMDMVK